MNNCVVTAWEILASVSGAVLALAAFIGLTTWRNEIRGRATFDLARRFVGLASEWVNAFHWAVSPFGSSAEYAHRDRREDESPDESHAVDERYARLKRLEPLEQKFPELLRANWEAELLLDEGTCKKTTEVLDAFRKALAELYAAVEGLYLLDRKLARHSDVPISDKEIKERQEYMTLIYSSGRNPLKERVDKALGNLKGTLRPVVRGRSWWRRLWFLCFRLTSSAAT